MTGLPLEVLTPAPVSRAAMPWTGSTARPVGPPGAELAAVQPPAQPAAMPATQEAASAARPPSSFLDKVLFTLFGTPDSKLTPEEQGEKQAGRKKASASATSAAENPGEQHMGIPSADGGNPLDSLFKVLSLFAGKSG